MPANIQSSVILSGMGDITRSEGITLYNDIVNATAGGGGENLAQTLAIAPAGDAGSLSITNLNTLEGVDSVLLTIKDNNGGGIYVESSTDLDIIIGTDFNITVGSNFVINGSDIDASAITGSLIVGGLGVKTNNIVDNGANMAIAQTFAGGSLDILTLDSNLTLFSGSTLTLRTSNNGDLDMIVHGAGVVLMNGSPTYTGTVAGAGALNIVNGLVIA